MIYGYARVSTAGQTKGNSLDEQRSKLEEARCDEIVLEAYTGTKIDRPKFTHLLNRLKPGDTLVVCKLDRFARTAAEGSNLVKSLLERGIKVHILNMGLIENTPTGKLILNVLLSFAEFERDMIVERTQAGKEVARQRDGYREGRKPLDIPERYYELRDKVDSGEETVVGACEILGIGRTTWYKWNKGVVA